MRRLMAALVTGALFGAGCAMTRYARLYDLSSPTILVATFKDAGVGHGPIWIGESLENALCRGEYSTVPHSGSGWGTIYGAGGSATVAASLTSSDQPGSAVVNCSDGRVIECEYVTSSLTGGGNGACRDNRSVRYRLMF